MVNLNMNVPANISWPTPGNTLQDGFDYGKTVYELSNHLGNVLATISDKKDEVQNGSTGVVGYYKAVSMTQTDYYPFGMQMVGRIYRLLGAYRYGFNGKENDDEVKGEGKQQDYRFRIYDPRLGKFLSVDPLTKEYPELTTYQFASNTPIQAIDLDGLEASVSIYGTGKNKGDEAQFKSEAEYDVKQKIAKQATKALTGQEVINILKTATKNEGSIQRVAFYSHASPHGIYLNDDSKNYGGILRSQYDGMNNRREDYKNTRSVKDIQREMDKGNIKFEKNAVVIFMGCNTASEKDSRGDVVNPNLAEDFTLKTGVTSIGSRGNSAPSNDGTNSRNSDVQWYLYERETDKNGGYTIKKTALGKKFDPSKVENVEDIKKYKTK